MMKSVHFAEKAHQINIVFFLWNNFNSKTSKRFFYIFKQTAYKQPFRGMHCISQSAFIYCHFSFCFLGLPSIFLQSNQMISILTWFIKLFISKAGNLCLLKFRRYVTGNLKDAIQIHDKMSCAV